MNLINESVKKLEKTICGTGCDHSEVVLKIRTGVPACQYIEGQVLEARYGGKTAQVVTNHPIQATTRVSYMYGAKLPTPEQRTAACAMINTVLGFLCLTRNMRFCTEDSHGPCYSSLKEQLEGSKVFCVGDMPLISGEMAESVVENPESADVLLVSLDGFVTDEGISVTERYLDTKRVIFLGPGTVGICRLMGFEHWCPFGRS